MSQDATTLDAPGGIMNSARAECNERKRGEIINREFDSAQLSSEVSFFCLTDVCTRMLNLRDHYIAFLRLVTIVSLFF